MAVYARAKLAVGELVTKRLRLSSVVVKYVSDAVQCAGHYDPTATRVAVGV